MDRTIHFGDDAADARYRIQDTSSTGGDFVLAEDLDGGTVLLEYDYSASEWVSRGPVNLNGNDITNAGSISADSLEAESATIDNTIRYAANPTELDTVLSNATDGDTIYLGPTDFRTNRTINKTVAIVGSGFNIGSGAAETATRILETWTFDSQASIERVRLSQESLDFNNSYCSAHMIAIRNNSAINVNSDSVILTHIVGSGDVTFASGTSNGDIAGVGGLVTITDNGTNL